MKRIICLMMALALCVSLCGCKANPRCEYEAAIAQLKDAEDVYCYIYSEEKGYSLDGEALAEMIEGQWEESKRPAKMDKILSFTISTQYEICIFEGEKSIIYCGYAGVFESDRQYYSCKLSADVSDICEYIVENGEEVVIEE